MEDNIVIGMLSNMVKKLIAKYRTLQPPCLDITKDTELQSVEKGCLTRAR
jgi:hypothetical protein